MKGIGNTIDYEKNEKYHEKETGQNGIYDGN